MEIPNKLTASGVCIFDNEQTRFYNPKVRFQVDFSVEEIESHKKDLSDNDFFSYADSLQKAGGEIAKLKPDVVLVPLRGAYRPWAHLSIYCNIPERGLFIPFTGPEKFKLETEDFLRDSLLSMSNKNELKVAVVDTAKGGYGSKTLKELLRKIKPSNFVWSIDYFLFYENDRHNAPWQWILQEHQDENFVVNLSRFPMERVIGEDKG